MNIYHASGHSYLVCPRLLELDARHGEHWSKHPPCRRLRDPARPDDPQCVVNHEHEDPLPDASGHMVNDFYWIAGCRPPTEEEHPVCGCGARLVHADLDDLYGAQHLKWSEEV